MADLAETETYVAGIYQLEITDPVIGGPDGIDNLQAKQLANRTNWLKAKIDSLLGFSVIHTATLKATPSDADEFGFLSSTAAWSLVKMTGTNLKAWLKTYFDTVYAVLNSPAFTGTPTAPTAAVGTNTTQLATTAFVIANKDILAEYTVTGAAVTSIDFSGLDINAHGGGYEIELRLINATASAPDIYGFVNGDTVNGNYYYQLLSTSGASVSAGQAPQALIGYMNASAPTHIKLDVAIISSKANLMFFTNRGVGTTSPTLWHGNTSKQATVINITQLTFTSSVAGAIGIGSKIIIRRKDK